MRIGIICEGSTDDVVLRAILRALCAPKDLTFSVLQPAVDQLGRVGLGGWQAVRKFLQQSANTIAATPLDMIVVQVDADVRRLPEIRANLTAEDGDGELDALCRHVKSWMSAGVPASVVIVLPRESTESWLVAASTRRKNVEAIEDPARALVEAGHLKSAEGKGGKVPRVVFERDCCVIVPFARRVRRAHAHLALAGHNPKAILGAVGGDADRANARGRLG